MGFFDSRARQLTTSDASAIEFIHRLDWEICLTMSNGRRE